MIFLMPKKFKKFSVEIFSKNKFKTKWKTTEGFKTGGASYSMDICFSLYIWCGLLNKSASYGMRLSKHYFFVGVNQKKVPVMAWGFQSLISLRVPTQKIGASYGIEISKPYFYLGVSSQNNVPVMAWNLPKKCASYGMEYPLLIFIRWLP